MSRYRKKVARPSTTEQLREGFEITCKKCGSKDVYLNYTEEGGYSEYTQWGSSLTIGCNACRENDMYLTE